MKRSGLRVKKVIEAAAFVAWPACMALVRGYYDAVTVLGDMLLVVGLGVICLECVLHELGGKGKE